MIIILISFTNILTNREDVIVTIQQDASDIIATAATEQLVQQLESIQSESYTKSNSTGGYNKVDSHDEEEDRSDPENVTDREAHGFLSSSMGTSKFYKMNPIRNRLILRNLIRFLRIHPRFRHH